MVVIDIDRFKQVNDLVGMAVGDSILLTIARRLSRLLKPQDTLARLSGDQFALILMSERESTRIVGFAETIRRALRAPIAFNDREIFLTASIGLALPENQSPRPEEVLKDAELAMYHAKRIGGDRIEIFKPAMRSRKTDRLTDRVRLAPRDRARGDQGAVPADRAAGGSLVAGFEALARWDHPKLGRLSPVEFISIAEEIGLIVDLGLFVLDRTARQLAALAGERQRARSPLFASVNVSSRQLLRHDLIQDLRTVLGRTHAGARLAQARDDRVAGDGEPRARGADADPHQGDSAPGCRSTTSAPAIPRWPICSASRSTPSRSTSPSCAPPRAARGR